MQHDPTEQDAFNPPFRLTRWVSISGKTGGEGVRNVLMNMSDELASMPALSSDLRDNAELVIAEVLNNIEEHAYQERPGGKFRVRLGIRAAELAVEIQDFGAPMPGLNLPEKREPDPSAPLEALQEGGFGWYLIHTLAPAPEYERRGATNVLRFTVTSD